MKKITAHWLVMSLVYFITAGVAQAQFQFFDSDGIRIRYLEQGAGEAVVLIHGHSSRIEDNWVETGVFDALAENHRVIAMDVRGYGESDKPHDQSAYGSQMAEDVIRLLDHLAIDRAHIIGYSMGTSVASWLVVNRPEHILSATLGASTYSIDSPENRRRWEENAAAWEAGEPYTVSGIKAGNPGVGDAEAMVWIARRTSVNDPIAIAANRRARKDLTINEEEFGATNVPILHVYGSLETPRRLAAADRLKSHVLPSVESVMVDDATHSMHSALYANSEFVEVISDFLERHHASR